jgi:hAT family C-terminal dimerisation region
MCLRLLHGNITKEPSGIQFLTLCCKRWSIDFRTTPRQAAINMSALLPTKCNSVKFASLGESLRIYCSFLVHGSEACQSEFERWQRKRAKISPGLRPGTLVDALRSCKKTLYPNIAILLQIFATIPVTAATAERSFSSIRLRKTYLRYTMKEERLNGLALPAIHKDIRLKYDEYIHTVHTRTWT